MASQTVKPVTVFKPTIFDRILVSPDGTRTPQRLWAEHEQRSSSAYGFQEWRTGVSEWRDVPEVESSELIPWI